MVGQNHQLAHTAPAGHRGDVEARVLGRGEEEASRESPEVPRPAGAREPGPSGALSDALKRKEQYLRQVATEGLAKLQSCLAQQSETLTETLCLRVWGDVVYWELARMRNHFLYRRAFVSGPWEDRRAGEGAAFENSKYIKTHLFTQTLSSEHLHALTHSLYTFITGPLAEERGPWRRRAGSFPHPATWPWLAAVTPQVRCLTRRRS